MGEDVAIPQEASRAQGDDGIILFLGLYLLVPAFSVLLFSMSRVMIDRWENMIDALSRSLNPTTIEVVAPPTARHDTVSVFSKRAINLDYLTRVLEKTVSADAALADTRIARMEDFMIVMLPGDR